MLHTLNSASPKLRRSILENCDTDLIKTFSEIAINTLQGNVNISKKTKADLEKYKSKLRKLACPKTSATIKRKLLVQSGGFLPTLLSIVATTILSSLFT